MKNIFYSCECILDKLIALTEEDIIIGLQDQTILSLPEKWMMIVHDTNVICLFCRDTVLTIKLFIPHQIFCLKRTHWSCDSCVDFLEFGDIHDMCGNCLEVLFEKLMKILIRVKK